MLGTSPGAAVWLQQPRRALGARWRAESITINTLYEVKEPMKRTLAAASLLLISMSAFAHGPHTVYVPIAGSVGNFRTDMRVLNPSPTNATSVTATFIPVCTLGGAAPAFTVTCSGTASSAEIPLPPRTMRAINDVVSTTFQGSGLGAIKLTAPTEGVRFDASARIYASVADGTLGQFAQAVDSHSGIDRGVLLQLSQTGVAGVKGTFRTNVGFVNPNTTATAVLTLTLHDATGAAVATSTLSMPPAAVLGPTGIGAFFPSTADLSDSWIHYSANQGIIAYASVIDNGTSDPTFIPAIPDLGAVTD